MAFSKSFMDSVGSKRFIIQLNYILSNGLRVIANIDSYFQNEENSTFEVYEENLLNCSFHYIHDKEIKGFTKSKKKKLSPIS